MLNITRTFVALALATCAGAFFSVHTSNAEENDRPNGKFRISVTDVLSRPDSLVRHVRVDVKPGSRVTIKSDDTELSTLASSPENQPDQSIVTIAVLADHLQWGKPKASAFKFLLSLQGNGDAYTSSTWPTTTEKQLDDLITVLIKSGSYEQGKAIPFMRFKDLTYSLTVSAEPSQP